MNGFRIGVLSRAHACARSFAIALLASTALCPVGAIAQSTQSSTAQSGVFNYSIPAGPLGPAISRFGDRSNIQVLYPAALVRGKQSPGVSGTMTRQQALSQLLTGSGLTYSFTGGNAVTIIDPNSGSNTTAASVDGAIALDTIDVSGGQGAVGWDGSAETVYSTPAMVSHVSAETIERYRGTSPADVLKGVPGVMTGASRANGGIDVNIHGLQGQGRVVVTVDGATNAMTTYHGYQGVANRSYIDPDFIGGIAIEKGPSMGATGAGAIGGTVSMRTLNADDIIPAGRNSAVRIKGDVGTNSSSPQPVGTPMITRGLVGYLWTAGTNGTPSAPLRDTDRPGLLLPTSGSGSVVYATRGENFELVLGAARRMSGNYHVGKNGNDVPKQASGICDGATGTILNYCNRGSTPYTLGLTAYLPGEEVLNTSQDIFSTLAKATFRYEDHTLELVQTHYDSIYGETNPFGFVRNDQRTSQNVRAMMTLNTYASRYRWNPDNDLLDFRLNASLTDLEEVSPAGSNSRDVAAKTAKMTSVDLSNTSRFETGLGEAAVTYGAAYLHEETEPVNKVIGANVARNGERSETSVFADSRWTPIDWLQFNGGLRYHRFSAEDKGRPDLVTISNRDADALDYALGMAVTPTNGVLLFANYKNAARMPSLFESISNTLITVAPGLSPERASNWEFGANLTTGDLLAANDKLKVKLAYFNNTVDDYIYRRAQRVAPYPESPTYFTTVLDITNLERAKFSGIEFSGQYDAGSFSAQLAATYYTNIEFCRTTATCINSSLGSDYATNHIPPRFSTSLTLSQKLFDDRLTLSGRATYHGGRAADAEPTTSGANPLIASIPWRPVLLLDTYADYKLTDDTKLTVSVENLTDQYYVDPLSLALVPSPGRTIRAGFTMTLGGSGNFFDGLSGLAVADARDWTGVYAGGHIGSATADTRITDFMMGQTLYLPGRDPTIFATNGPIGTDGDGGSGMIGGARIGYNHQFGSVVLGAELEGSWGDIETISAFSLNNFPPSTTTYDAIASASVKAGIAFGDALAYGKVGLGIASYEGSFAPINAPVLVDYSGTAVGLTAGAGLEYALTDNLSLFGEYQHMRLRGSKQNAFLDQREEDGVGTTYAASWRNKASVDLFKTGVNIRF